MLAGAGSSGPGGLVSNSIAIGVSGEVASSNVDALATVSGGYGEPASFFKVLGTKHWHHVVSRQHKQDEQHMLKACKVSSG